MTDIKYPLIHHKHERYQISCTNKTQQMDTSKATTDTNSQSMALSGSICFIADIISISLHRAHAIKQGTRSITSSLDLTKQATTRVDRCGANIMRWVLSKKRQLLLWCPKKTADHITSGCCRIQCQPEEYKLIWTLTHDHYSRTLTWTYEWSLMARVRISR